MSWCIKVDKDLCQGHGMCHMEAPELFALTDGDGPYQLVQVLDERPPDALRAKAEAAADSCPNRVISIVEE